MKRFTAIYEKEHSGFPPIFSPEMKRFELEAGETVGDALDRLKIGSTTRFLFVGWPPLQGEEEED